MMNVREARAAMLEAVAPLGSEDVALDACFGRMLAASVVAARDQPPFSPSAMDGYALRAADTPGTLRVVGESAAGHTFARALRQGQAIRISTGAPMPEGADAVLIQEEARLDGDALAAPAVPTGRHVRPRGGDFHEGETLLQAGRKLDPAAVALAAANGAAELAVSRAPHLTILCGGDEIVAPSARPRADQIYDSCSYGIEALALRWGARVTRRAPLSDDPDAIEAAARAAIENSDLVVFIGSASVGPHDHARPAFERLGASLLVPKVDMRPGKPTWFATTPKAPVLGLPGNPASALVAAALFLRPLLSRLQGADPDVPLNAARAAHALDANGPREAYLRATLTVDAEGRLTIDAAADQDSSLLSVFARANALLVRPAGATRAEAGEVVTWMAWPD